MPGFLLSLLVVGCDWTPPADDSEASPDSEPDSEQGGDDSESGPIEATVEGTVSVVVTRTGADGTRESVEWADSTCGDEYPFGWIFVTAYEEDESPDGKHHLAEQVIREPTTGENDFSLALSMEQAGPVQVYAVVDYWGDRVIGTDDYVGAYPQTIEVVADGEHEGADITIFVPECYTPGGCPGDVMTISGDVIITASYAGGEAMAMLRDQEGLGPYHEVWIDPVSTGGGAEAAYTLSSCVDWGPMALIAAWDSNGNEMADPLDRWGAYVSEPDVDGNPITVGDADLTGMDIQVPLGDESGINIVPFVSWSGEVSVYDGVFDDLPTGSEVYVMALKYRPSGDVAISTLEDNSYDVQTFSWADLSGQSSVSYSLRVPGNSIAYLWAYADEDGDGVVNESEEHVSSGGTHQDGKLPTGTTSTANLNVVLAVPAD